MNLLKKIGIHTCIYTVLLTAFLFLFALAGLGAPYLPAGQFFLLLFFGLILSLAELIFSASSMKYALRLFLHFLILLLSFIILCLVTGKIEKTAASIFVAIFLFAILYFAVFGVTKLLRKLAKTKK